MAAPTCSAWPDPHPAAARLVQAPGDAHGAGGVPSAGERSAALLALETEGLVLDTDYTARAFPTALRELAADGLPVVFWHTGGLAGAISDYATAAIDLDAAALRPAPRCSGADHDRAAATSHPEAAQRRPQTSAAPELVESGFELENADAPLLHAGSTWPTWRTCSTCAPRHDPGRAARRCWRLLLEAVRTAAEDFPYDPAFGEPYNSRERFFVSRIGDDAGWLHAGRPRREAVRIALRLHLRDQVVDLMQAGAALADALRPRPAHSRTWMPDQTYLQHAQPSTFGHYLLSFAYPVLRDAAPAGRRARLDQRQPGRRRLRQRQPAARRPRAGGPAARLRRRHRAHPRRDVADRRAGRRAGGRAPASSAPRASSPRTWRSGASSEFDYVDLADGFSRASVLMPQKRNPYALSIIRGASGTLIGRLSGFLAVVKSPSARSDNLIYAYGEVPRALDLALRTTRLTDRRGAHPAGQRRPDGRGAGPRVTPRPPTWPSTSCRPAASTTAPPTRWSASPCATASRGRHAGRDLAGDDARRRPRCEHTGRPLGTGRRRPVRVLDPRHIVATRTAAGRRRARRGRGDGGVLRAEAAELSRPPRRRPSGFAAAEDGRWPGARPRRDDAVDRRCAPEMEPMTPHARATVPDEVGGRQRRAAAVRRRRARPGTAGRRSVDWRIAGRRRPRRCRRAAPPLRRPRARRSTRPTPRWSRRLDTGRAHARRRRPAGEVVPGAGAAARSCTAARRSTGTEVCDPLRRSMRAAVVAEGWAADVEEAGRLLADGRGGARRRPTPRRRGPDGDRDRPVAAGLGRRERRQAARRAFAPISQGPGDVAVVRPGDRRPRSSGCASSRDAVGPAAGRRPWRGRGPVDVLALAAPGRADGRRRAHAHPGPTNLLLRNLLPQLVASDRPRRWSGAVPVRKPPVLPHPGDGGREVADRVGRAGGGRSMVTTMARNGTDFGIRLAGSATWFLAGSRGSTTPCTVPVRSRGRDRRCTSVTAAASAIVPPRNAATAGDPAAAGPPSPTSSSTALSPMSRARVCRARTRGVQRVPDRGASARNHRRSRRAGPRRSCRCGPSS